MECKDAIYSNECYDFIRGPLIDVKTYPNSVCIQNINRTYDIAYVLREDSLPLNFNNYCYNAVPKCYTPLDRSALEASGILRIQNQPTLSLRGQGVLIGFIDTGIDYVNQVFRTSDGNTRILSIWDQSDRSGTEPEGFLYGSEYREAMINEALNSGNPREIVPVTDEEGHGTFLASVAAGSENLKEDFIGAAPYARIAMVKLKRAKNYLRDFYFISKDALAYQENDIMAGLAYLDRLAHEYYMPLVVCFGMGTNIGSHTGATPLDSMMNVLALNNGRSVVTAVGNEANERHHYFGQLAGSQTSQDVEINVGENVTGFSLEMWARAPQRFDVEIISPTGERMPREYILSGGREFNFLFENTTVTVDYRISGILDGSQLIYIRFVRPSQGLWTIRVFQEADISTVFQMWLPMGALLSGEVYFVRSNPDTTITVPSTAAVPMAVGAYDPRDDSIYLQSGRGFTPDGLVKPDFVAPGVDVFGVDPGNLFTTRTGTSAAAAVTAGAVALMLEWGIVRGNYTNISSIEIKNMLIRSAARDKKRSYPDKAFGWGRLDLYQAFEDYRIR